MNQSEIIFQKSGQLAAGLEKVKLKLDLAYRPDGRPWHVGVGKGRRRETTKQREAVFWTHVIKGKTKNDCWIWTAGKNQCGYGRFSWGGRTSQAHRLSYYLATGKDPYPMFVLHKCDVRDCVNPKHLFLGTDKINAEDADRKGRRIYPKGEHSGASKITAKQVLKIVLFRRKSRQAVPLIAKKFNVSVGIVAKILTGRSWSTVTGFPWAHSHSRPKTYYA